MKQFVISLFLLLIAGKTFSQQDSVNHRYKKEIDINYNWSHLGRSLNINYNQYIGRHALIIGIKKHYNSVITDNQNYTYYKRGYATNFGESIGLNIGYKFDLLRKHEYLMPYLFLQSQISKMRFKETYDVLVTSPNGYYVRVDSETSEPVFTTENNFGFGLKVKLFRKIFLNQTIGGGIATFKRATAFYRNGKLTNYDLELSSSIKIGLIYQLNK